MYEPKDIPFEKSNPERREERGETFKVKLGTVY
jgi:hypothetical protein